MAARWAPPLPARNSKLGYDYIHSVVKDHSCYAYTEIPDDEIGRAHV